LRTTKYAIKIIYNTAETKIEDIFSMCSIKKLQSKYMAKLQ